MKAFFRFVFLVGALLLFLSSGWVSYSDDKPCPARPRDIGEDEFLSAHGLSQDNFSIWLREHSIWQKQYSDELKSFTFIPQEHDTDRR